jgi:hypothetical protein
LLHSQCARCKLNASKQSPYEATTSTRLNSHGSEERTQEDTMNPMRRSPSLPLDIWAKAIYVGGTGGEVPFRQCNDFIDEFLATLYMSGIHAVCRGVCSA